MAEQKDRRTVENNPDIPSVLPVLPLMTTIIFPLGVTAVQLGFERNTRLIKDSSQPGAVIALVWAKYPTQDRLSVEMISRRGVAAKILNIKEFPKNSIQVTFEGLARINLDEVIQAEPYFKAKVSLVPEKEGKTEEVEPLIKKSMDLLEKLIEHDSTYPRELTHVFNMNVGDASRFADMVASTIHFNLSTKQEILECVDIKERLEKLVQFLQKELEGLRIAEEIDAKVKTTIDKESRTRYLREELKEIQRELGMVDPAEKEVEELKEKILKASLPLQVEKQTLLEAERLKLISPASAEYGRIRSYIDWVLSLTWKSCGTKDIDIERVEAILNQEFFGQKKVKEKVMEYISILKLKKGLKGAGLCFVGPPGTGKSSLAQSIAKALGRQFVRISVEGVRDEAEIRGHRMTYTGALPGKILRVIRQAKCSDPVLLLEGMDKLSMDKVRGELTAALLEVLDPQFNRSFVDHYLGIPYDLSGIMFIATAHILDNIPEPIQDLLEVIEFTGFIEEEKVEIAKRYLIPLVIRMHGLKTGDIEFTDHAIIRIIREYTVEAGIRALQRGIETICGYCARSKASGEDVSWKIAEGNVEKYLGTPLYITEKIQKNPEVGVAIGLSWTEAGGDIMLIEALKMRGSGNVILTGQLGDVMRESIQASHSYVRSKAELLGVNYDDFANYDIHIHFPGGAIPKDGPSAGVTICLVLASVMSEKPIKNDIAMTGEVSLRGKVLPVGGLREKVSAAHRIGIRKVILPLENEKNLADLPEDVRNEMTFIFVERVEDVLKEALIDYEEPRRRSEDLFLDEIDRIKKSIQTRKPKLKKIKHKNTKIKHK
ncbi:MAG: endopeptidase La [candidate division Zixibacteria bacterium]|nr:endopeptidase La [candidate division Zixibacteria bacterium]